MKIDYIGSGIFMAGIAFTIFRWVYRTVLELRSPPPPAEQLEAEILREVARARKAARRSSRTSSPPSQPR